MIMGRSDALVCVPDAGKSCLVGADVSQVETEAGESLARHSAVSIGFKANVLKLFDESGVSIEGAAASVREVHRARA